MKIIFTGGTGRFGTIFQKKTKLKNILYPTKKELNILDLNSIEKYLKKKNRKLLYMQQPYLDQWRFILKRLIKVLITI